MAAILADGFTQERVEDVQLLRAGRELRLPQIEQSTRDPLGRAGGTARLSPPGVNV